MFDEFSISSTGGRSINMDARQFVEQGGVGCWVVADGLGGHANSEVASKAAVEAVIEGFRAAPAVSADLVAALIQKANQAVLAAKSARKDLNRIATTLVVMLSDRRQAVWGHVGDSRLYMLRSGSLFKQTRDHSITQAQVDAGELTQEQARNDRAGGGLLKAVGLGPSLRPAISEPLALCRGDAFLLCVDGFWEHVHEVEMEIDWAKSGSAREWLAYLERRVAGRQEDDSDNYTAMTAWMNDPALPLPAQSGAPGTGRRRIIVPITTGVICVLLLTALAAFLVIGSPGFWDWLVPVKPTKDIAVPASTPSRTVTAGTPSPAAAAVPGAMRANRESSSPSDGPGNGECETKWKAIANIKDVSTYEAFYKEFAGCPYAETARIYAKQGQAWKDGANNVKALTALLATDTFSEGPWVAEAKQRKDKLASDAASAANGRQAAQETEGKATRVLSKCKGLPANWEVDFGNAKRGADELQAVGEFVNNLTSNRCAKEYKVILNNTRGFAWETHEKIREALDGARRTYPADQGLREAVRQLQSATVERKKNDFVKAAQIYRKIEHSITTANQLDAARKPPQTRTAGPVAAPAATPAPAPVSSPPARPTETTKSVAPAATPATAPVSPPAAKPTETTKSVAPVATPATAPVSPPAARPTETSKSLAPVATPATAPVSPPAAKPTEIPSSVAPVEDRNQP